MLSQFNVKHSNKNEETKEIFSPRYETRFSKIQYRIILRSVDRVNTAETGAVYKFNIQLQYTTCNQMAVHMKSLVFMNSGSTNNTARSVHIKEIINRHSYSTSRSGPTDIIALIQGYNLINVASDIGVQIIDPVSLMNNQLTVYFNDINTTTPNVIGTTSSSVDAWAMELVLVEL